MANYETAPALTRDAVIEAHELIRQHVHLTPVLTNKTLTELASTPRDASALVGTNWEGRTPSKPKIRLWFKCENLQRIGAFKVRGAFHALEKLKREPGWLEGGGPEKGVATHSSGNHAQALSLAARENGFPAHVVMPTISPASKIAATQGYGANVLFSGSTGAEREALVAEVIEKTGARLVPPYNHPDIILGQGTMGLELQDQTTQMIKDSKTSSSRLDAIMTPCGGGGMLSGVALSCEGTGIKVFGAEPEFQGADDCKRGLETGQRITETKTLTIADGLRTYVGDWPWTIIHDRKLVEGVYSVTEQEIKDALKLVLERMKVVIEPSAAVPLAVALYNEDFRAMVEREAGESGWDLGIVFSGGNMGVDRIKELFD